MTLIVGRPLSALLNKLGAETREFRFRCQPTTNRKARARRCAPDIRQQRCLPSLFSAFRYGRLSHW